MIEVKGLVKAFGPVRALDGLFMHVERGSIYGLVGPNGAGKTTVLQHVAGVMRPDEGEVLVDGETVFEQPEVKERIAYVPSDFWFFRQARVGDMKELHASVLPRFDGSYFDSLADEFSLDQQATKYKAIFQHAVDWNKNHQNGPNVTLIQVWGPTDNNSWVGTDKNSGRSNAPLLYTGSYQPKPCYTAIQSIIPDSQWTTGIPYTGPGGGTYTPPSYDPDENGYYFHATFESGTDGFSGRGAASVSKASGGYNSSNALLCEGRTATWNGAAIALSPAFKAGEAYSFSVNAMSKDGGDTSTFKLTLQYTGSDGQTKYDEIASGTAPKGEWVQLANTNFKIPSGAENVYIYVETDKGSTSFYVDDVKIAAAGTEIEGAVGGQFILGDVNSDGIINSMDMIAARKLILSSNKSADLVKLADVEMYKEKKAHKAGRD